MSSDPFASLYPSFLKLLFNLKPAEASDVWPLIATMYRNDPNCLTLISPLHQNHAQDKLHFSLELHGFFCSYRIHVYGYWRSSLVITHAEYTLLYQSQVTEPKLLVNFARSETRSDTRSVSEGSE